MWCIDVGYASEKWDDGLDEKIVTAAGTEPWGSGMGWGIRDMQFEFDHYVDAEKALDRIKTVFDPPMGPEHPAPDEYLGMYQEMRLP
jgi:hypothetical protein